MQPSFYAQTVEDIEAYLSLDISIKNPSTKAKHLLKEIYNFALGKNDHINISKNLLPKLQTDYSLTNPCSIDSVLVSNNDGSAKFIIKTGSDNALIETVLIPEKNRLTQCISSQVGCKMGCTFCQTGRLGFSRNLSAEEIIGQVLAVEKYRLGCHELQHLSSYNKVSNVVFMGMGEPLDNLAAVLQSIKIFNYSHSFNISNNKITVSTIALLPQLTTLLDNSSVGVAISLHSPFAVERAKLIPVSERVGFENIISTLRTYSNKMGRMFFVQYMLIDGLNDSPAHAQELAKCFAGINFKVNIIPVNEIQNSIYRRPNTSKIYAFQQALKKMGIVATVRLSKGLDIEAACGQLIAKRNT